MQNPRSKLAQRKSSWAPMPAAVPGDWLWSRAGKGQTFEAWHKSSPNVPTKKRNVIYLQPLGSFDVALAPDMKQLR